MMHIFRELWREADIQLNQMVENQTDFDEGYFLADIQMSTLSNYADISTVTNDLHNELSKNGKKLIFA